ncbi:hypothetical protein BO78DRAFT_412760 [Aspergillus sclerotiicarbonarius CBS 121057]|uniref:Uncharacterized protein n=1 Tax=Aspergillus sclerotiicarbonarius (strain CBS 121057 / IBT 28362) TaxID=1448318 RepID=A0A319EQ97_ASPSB|nr:hypothetical protein BO78DRAFT_412760 [Aspergillus sclerotiicarbonarius CBS 121057]
MTIKFLVLTLCNEASAKIHEHGLLITLEKAIDAEGFAWYMAFLQDSQGKELWSFISGDFSFLEKTLNDYLKDYTGASFTLCDEASTKVREYGLSISLDTKADFRGMTLYTTFIGDREGKKLRSFISSDFRVLEKGLNDYLKDYTRTEFTLCNEASAKVREYGLSISVEEETDFRGTMYTAFVRNREGVQRQLLFSDDFGSLEKGVNEYLKKYPVKDKDQSL